MTIKDTRIEMVKKEIVISGTDKEIYVTLYIGGISIVCVRGNTFKDCGTFYLINCVETHQTIEKVKGLIVRDYRI